MQERANNKKGKPQKGNGMTWKELAASAMKALMNGDNATAVTNWKASIALIERTKNKALPNCPDLLLPWQMRLADDGDLIDGIEP
ncbi:MAG: hypothetical protein IPL73_02775 [Candidatus Obscuribacter sp.]|nr:hypothetical protein [Candidatus Obscuribacter sp.]